MPETFGTGTALAPYDDYTLPALLWQASIPNTTTASKIFLPNCNTFIVTAIDVVTDGAGDGGFFSFIELHSGRTFWVGNVGTNSDTFSWRGFLVIPFQSGCGLKCDNVTGQTVEVYVSGLVSAAAAPSF